ncbi:MAG: type III pantothenate kinase [Coriobacteriales bacterium]|jgi:type III pantothenate kinase|nr:type III pantothenate kinase [Coriobacteriales bacterium]
MLLAVDVGNTQTVLGLYEYVADKKAEAGKRATVEPKLIFKSRIASAATDSTDEILLKLTGLFSLNGVDTSAISVVAVASVVPSLTEQWQEVALTLTDTKPLILTSSTPTGLSYRYSNPAEIGADRIADAVAAIHLYGAPVLVVDFGTATNIEVIDKEGAFVGGIIAPGLAISADALFAAAARLSNIAIEIPEKIIGSSTKGAVQTGLTYGEIDRIDGLVRRVFSELGYEASVVATGGLSHRVLELSGTITHVNDDLTLEGLRLIYEQQ